MGANEGNRIIPLAVVSAPAHVPAIDDTPPEPLPVDRRVKQRYDGMAKQGASSLCCAPGDVYDPAELEGIPAWALELSSGCGAPLRGIALKEGDTVVDFGCGAGLDLMLAARRVGHTGRVIGIDASPQMVKVARRAAMDAGFRNIDVRVGDIRRPPVAQASADIVITNCVLAMFPDKDHVLSEIARILKPGGFAVVSDVLSDTAGVMPEESSTKWEECLVGLTESAYTQLILDAGFSHVTVLQRQRVPYRHGAEVLNVKAIAHKSTVSVTPQPCCGQ